ncbi:hypothetical protein GCM10023321_13940 [Pseudonocardia eucalypti]|uniref:Uncharacterized protein n=1 Tax=Pseudonocardia eucalypti TaxID=648755 RepID=A0ABP9PQ03_9PSEU|nr:hypothetical protein [Pseudonocardia eucalypti]
MTTTEPGALATTRRTLHGIAELLLAGPQHRNAGTIRLQVTPGGFGTVVERDAGPWLRVDGPALLSGHTRIDLAGRTYNEVAATAGIRAGAPEDVYRDGAGVDANERITLDPDALATIVRAFEDGDRALRGFAPELTPVLWPEHFDVAVTVDEVNYGVSPGDTGIGEPYAYVGPHRPRSGPFWDAPFGAARTVRQLGDTAGIQAFFDEGRAEARR